MLKKLKKLKFTLFLFLFLLIITLYPTKAYLNIVNIFSIFSIFVLLVIGLKINKYFYYIILSLLVVVITAQSVFVFLYKSQLGYPEIEAMALTNATEAKGMLRVMSLSIVVLFLITSVLFFFTGRELAKLNIKFKNICMFIVTYLLFFLGYLGYKINENTEQFSIHSLKASKSFYLYYYLRETAPIFYTAFYSGFLYHRDQIMFDEYRNLPKTIEEGIVYNNLKAKNNQRIFVVLGESLTRQNMSLYGYEQQITTPFMDSLYMKNKLKFYNGVSGASITNRAIPFLISASNPNLLEGHFLYKNVIELANDISFMTFWLSNQPKTGILNVQANQSTPTYLGMTAKYSYFVNNEEYIDDFNLIDHYFKNEYINENNQLVFFHLRGSHLPYDEGFDDQDVLDGIVSTNDTLEYNKTIRHTDRFIEKLYNEIDLEKDVILFVSDHGEDIGVGHRLGQEIKHLYDVPFIIINNKENESFDFINHFITDDGLISSHSLYYLISYMLGYHISQTRIEETKDNTKAILATYLLLDYDNLE